MRRQQLNLRAQIYMPTKLFANGTSRDSSIFYDSNRTHLRFSLRRKLSPHISDAKKASIYLNNFHEKLETSLTLSEFIFLSALAILQGTLTTIVSVL